MAIQRSRGYAFEKYIVDNFNKSEWQARRLGGTTTNLCDIIAVNNNSSKFFAIEAKSTVFNNTYVPLDEFIRCNDMLEMFSLYKERYTILAFKFGVNNVRKDKSKRTLGSIKKYYFKITFYKNIDNLSSIGCNKDGIISLVPISKMRPLPKILFYRYTDIIYLKNNKFYEDEIIKNHI